jgi:hypothetical protein
VLEFFQKKKLDSGKFFAVLMGDFLIWQNIVKHTFKIFDEIAEKSDDSGSEVEA